MASDSEGVPDAHCVPRHVLIRAHAEDRADETLGRGLAQLPPTRLRMQPGPERNDHSEIAHPSRRATPIGHRPAAHSRVAAGAAETAWRSGRQSLEGHCAADTGISRQRVGVR